MFSDPVHAALCWDDQARHLADVRKEHCYVLNFSLARPPQEEDEEGVWNLVYDRVSREGKQCAGKNGSLNL